MSRNRRRGNPTTPQRNRVEAPQVAPVVVVDTDSAKHPRIRDWLKRASIALFAVLASIGGLGKIIDWYYDSPRFSVSPRSVLLAVGNDIRGSGRAHELTIVMPCAVFNDGKRKLNPSKYSLKVKLKDGSTALIPAVRTPKAAFDIVRTKSNLDDVFNDYHDLTQDVNPIDPDGTRYGYICFKSQDVTYEMIDELKYMDGEVYCLDPRNNSFHDSIFLKNINSFPFDESIKDDLPKTRLVDLHFNGDIVVVLQFY